MMFDIMRAQDVPKKFIGVRYTSLPALFMTFRAQDTLSIFGPSIAVGLGKK